MGPSHLDWLEVMEALAGPPTMMFGPAYCDRVLRVCSCGVQINRKRHMPDKFKASTQYGDMFGSVSLDGWQHAPLHELAAYCEIPSGYVPVGFSLFRLHPDEEGKLPFRIACAESEEYDRSLSEVNKNGKSGQELGVRLFSGRVPVNELEGLFKRVDITVLHKGLKEANVVIQYDQP
jgi:hypothetical protein